MKDRKLPGARRPQQKPDLENQNLGSLPWNVLEQQVAQMQKHIAQAARRGNKHEVHRLQQDLMEAQAARLLAVRRVTEENQGKDTAGVDGVKSLTAMEQISMASAIHPRHWDDHPLMPVRRVWIPKPGMAEQRPLAILPMIDRCKQALAKLALEPEWEVKFEPHSYGFRPGRRPRDAIKVILHAIENRPAYVFDADIEGAFDNINQAALLDKLQTFPALTRAIDAWLKAGVMDGDLFFPSDRGIPQGGNLSPLLMNVALHGMEAIAGEVSAGSGTEKPLLVRYADDFVVFHSRLEELQRAARRVTRWLAAMGLRLRADKTRITHTLTPYRGLVGFDFLGFTIRQYPAGQAGHGRSPRFKTSTTPSEKAIKRHMVIIEQLLSQLRAASQAQVISELDPIISGWMTYYAEFAPPATLSQCDSLMEDLLLRWASQRHPHQQKQWLLNRYWHRSRHGLIFSTPEGLQLRTHHP
jgi:RNA-directed DNA polymerase